MATSGTLKHHRKGYVIWFFCSVYSTNLSVQVVEPQRNRNSSPLVYRGVRLSTRLSGHRNWQRFFHQRSPDRIEYKRLCLPSLWGRRPGRNMGHLRSLLIAGSTLFSVYKADTNSSCSSSQFSCPGAETVRCYPRLFICDGDRECPDGFDEAPGASLSTH